MSTTPESCTSNGDWCDGCQHTCGLCHIQLQHVGVVRGGQTLLNDVSMHIHCGQLTALVGQNGAGKTTLVRALLDEIPYTGQIAHVDGQGRDFSRLRTGYVPQHLEFDKEMPVTVADFMASAMSRRPVWLGVSKKTQASIQEALAQVKAQDLMLSPLGKLSGGEMQRVLLALALTPPPDLLVLDEPVSGIDQNGLALFLDTVLGLRARHHMAILLISHDLSLVEAYADHVVLLDKQVLTQGTPREVFSSDAFHSTFQMPKIPQVQDRTRQKVV